MHNQSSSMSPLGGGRISRAPIIGGQSNVANMIGAAQNNGSSSLNLTMRDNLNKSQNVGSS